MSERVGITKVDSDGIEFKAAHVDCERCEPLGGWDGSTSGLGCPFGCGVRVFSVSKQEDERYRAESAVRDQITRDRRTLRKANKPAPGQLGRDS